MMAHFTSLITSSCSRSCLCPPFAAKPSVHPLKRAAYVYRSLPQALFVLELLLFPRPPILYSPFPSSLFCCPV
uniref:Uncharacterized protein n=1 Tax=Arundo donax TaxID=35708 RepID=A0A0A9EFP9_ARUDO